MLGLVVLLLTALLLLIVLIAAGYAWRILHPNRRSLGYALAKRLPTDPADLKLDHHEHDVETGRATLPVWEINRSGESDHTAAAVPRDAGQPPPLPVTAVFIHGWGGSRIDTLSKLDRWPTLVERMILYDRPGHGDSPHDSARLGTDEVDDLFELIAFIQSLETDSSLPVILVGHSLGANIAIAAAADERASAHNIRAVIALSPVPDFHTATCNRLRMMHLPTRPMSDLAMMFVAALGRRIPDPRATIDAVALPLLLIYGEQDRVVDAATLRSLGRDNAHVHHLSIAEATHEDTLTRSCELEHRQPIHDLIAASITAGIDDRSAFPSQ